MRKSILLAFAVVLAAAAMAQSSDSGLRVWEGDVVTYQAPVDNIDSITFVSKSAIGDALVGDLITGITPIIEDGVEVGYTMNFLHHDPINIYHGRNGADGQDGVDGQDGADGHDGKDGADGKDGKDGANGANGADGHSPVIAVAKADDGINYWTIDGEWIYDTDANKIRVTGQNGKDGVDGKDGKDGVDGKDGANGANGADGHSPLIAVAKADDGISYWTLDGEWILDTDSNKIRVTGQDGKDGKDGVDGINGTNGVDGITPLFKIEEDFWWVSYDNGEAWTKLNQAKGDKGDKGDKGEQGDSMLQSITQDEDSVRFTLANGETIGIPKHQPISSPDGYNVTGTKSGYQYVDLGLPSGTKWATCNVGSNLPTGRGMKFAWGETEVKSEYTQANYVPDYNSLPNCISGTQYDAATANLGAPWQIPTREQMAELANYATFTETTYNDVAGYRITGPNGNSIFIPKFPDSNTMNFIYMTGDKQTSNSQYKNYIYCISPTMFRDERNGGNPIYAPSSFPAVGYQQCWSRLSTSNGQTYSYTGFYYASGYYIRPVWNE